MKVSHPPIILLLWILLVSFGCQMSTPEPASAVKKETFSKPTATEVFNLRTNCAEFGEKLNSQYEYTGLVPGMLKQEHLSRYDPKTNRCYVDISVHPNLALLVILAKGNAKALKMRDDFLEAYEMDYTERYLYDGQTGEELASTQNGLKRVPSRGSIKGRLTNVEWFEAFTYIEELMADDPKQ